MIYNLAQTGVLLLALLALYGLCCRLALVSWKTHQPTVVAFHLLLALACLGAAYNAVEMTADVSHVCAIAATLLWLSISYETWRDGPPPYTERAT